MNEYTKLLKTWCDRLIELQITDIKDPTVYGGIICPACSRIHGRIADTVYPMILLYHMLNDEKYLKSAMMLVDWSEHNLLLNGGYNNDKVNNWRSTSVFSAIALGDTLMHHGECLGKTIYGKFKKIFVRLTDFVYEYFTSEDFKAHINYYASLPHLMALAYLLTNNEKYKILADKSCAFIKKHFNSENLLLGEGYPLDGTTEKGCNYIDIGYNVEESLPALINYAYLLGYEEDLVFFAEKFKAHIEFMLPDGAWDNSFGTRACKWTYWGSRTSDGCQTGLILLKNFDPVFAEAAQRNFELYEKCTYNGLLHGGKMYAEAKEEPCVHHTFCHAKAVAKMIDYKFKHKKSVKLPREYEYGLKHFATAGARLISLGEWKATVCDSDSVIYRNAAVSGGAISLLWHNKAGMIFSSSMNSYNRLIEPTNMQLTRNWVNSDCCTLRLKNSEKSSNNDIYAVCTHNVTEEKIKITASGTLRDSDYNGSDKYTFIYTFFKDKISVSISSDTNALLAVPLIASKGEFEKISDTLFEVKRNGTKIQLRTEHTMEVQNSRFSLIGGFEFVPLTAFVHKEFKFEIAVI